MRSTDRQAPVCPRKETAVPVAEPSQPYPRNTAEGMCRSTLAKILRVRTTSIGRIRRAQEHHRNRLGLGTRLGRNEMWYPHPPSEQVVERRACEPVPGSRLQRRAHQPIPLAYCGPGCAGYLPAQRSSERAVPTESSLRRRGNSAGFAPRVS